MHGLAERLGRTVGEIEKMPAPELMDWLAYDKMKAAGGPKQTPAMMRAVLRGAAMKSNTRGAR